MENNLQQLLDYISGRISDLEFRLANPDIISELQNILDIGNELQNTGGENK